MAERSVPRDDDCAFDVAETERAQALAVTAIGPAESVDRFLFLHGGGASSWSWRETAERTGARCLLVDLPEHGGSAHVGPFSIPFAAQLVIGIARKEASRVHLVGLSVGAQVALEVLSRGEPEFGSVVALGCAVQGSPMLGNEQLLRLVFSLYAPLQHLPALVGANRRALGVPDRFAPEFAADTAAATPAMLARVVAASARFRVPRSFGACEPPVLVAVGAHERMVMKRSALELRSKIHNATAYEVAGAGHNWPLSDAYLCAKALRRWVAGERLPPAFRPLPRPR